MPQYFFDIDDNVIIRDATGQNFPDYEAAKTEAFRCAAEYGGDAGNLRASGVIVVTVRDVRGAIVLRLRLVCQVEQF